jgi:hypothetical protein
MKTYRKILFMVHVMLLVLTVPASALEKTGVQAPGNGEVSADTTQDRPAHWPRVHFQAGVHTLIAGDELERNGKDWLITFDLSFLRGERRNVGWGLGLHSAFDHDGGRIGAKGLGRIPLGGNGSTYFQLAPGFYFWADDAQYEIKKPSYFLEAELGYKDIIAIVASVEALEYGEPKGGKDLPGGTNVCGYLGVRGGQKPGLIVTVGAAVVAGAIFLFNGLSGSGLSGLSAN